MYYRLLQELVWGHTLIWNLRGFLTGLHQAKPGQIALFTLENTTTSTVEGSHGALKRELRLSTGDLQGVVSSSTLFLHGQHTAVRAAIAQAKIRLPRDLGLTLFEHLLGLVFPAALRSSSNSQPTSTTPRVWRNTACMHRGFQAYVRPDMRL